MKLLGSSTDTIDGDKNSELVPKLASADLVLVLCNIVNNSYQRASKVLFTFVPNKKYGQLITVSPETLIMLKTVNTEFSFIEIWFTDQDNRPLEIEDSVNISLIVLIILCVLFIRHSLEPEYGKYVKGYGFLSFARNFGGKYGKKLMNTAIKTGTNFNNKYVKN